MESKGLDLRGEVWLEIIIVNQLLIDGNLSLGVNKTVWEKV